MSIKSNAQQVQLTYADSGEYRAGSCNIGPAEIARRRAFGHAAVVATVVLLVALVVIHAPAVSRLLLVLPAGGAASGYLQARFRFCANFGSRGLYNFGSTGSVTSVANADDRRRDRIRALQIELLSLAIGVAVAIAAILLPL